eukprot:m.258650 g.258650  ORF g.258650 m.258650 type:complete len:99 (-) comp19648_c0_seq2:732-1028(-)
MCAACNVVADVARQRQTDAKTPLALGAQGALVLHLDTARDGVLLPALVSDLLECTGIKSLDDRTHSMQTVHCMHVLLWSALCVHLLRLKKTFSHMHCT